MKYFSEDIKTIYQTERMMLVLMCANLLGSLALMIFGIIHLSPASPMIKIGYGDIGGYRDGSWTEMLVFPIIAIILGVFHNLIAIKIFHKRGGGMAKFFIITTSALIAGAFIVLVRLVKEG